MRIVWNSGYGYPAIKGNMSSVINYMSVCHDKMNMDTMSKTIKAWNKHASMQSREKECYFVKDSVANGSIARLMSGSKTSGHAPAWWDSRSIGRFYRD
jgi:hypothetical protein